MSRSLVVVSNAPCLKGSKLGRIIDSFDEVLRFNSFRTKGFEEDVGSRVTIWSRMYRVDKMPALSPGVRRLAREYAKKKDRKKAANVRRCELIPARINNWCRQEVKQSQEHVSSGLLVLAYLLEEFTVIHTAGFFKTNLGQNEFARHYCQPDREGRFPKGHAPLKEKTLYDRWVNEGRIIELPLPGEDHYGNQDCWSNPCSVRIQQVSWQTPGKDRGNANDKASVQKSDEGKPAG